MARGSGDAAHPAPTLTGPQLSGTHLFRGGFPRVRPHSTQRYIGMLQVCVSLKHHTPCVVGLCRWPFARAKGGFGARAHRAPHAGEPRPHKPPGTLGKRAARNARDSRRVSGTAMQGGARAARAPRRGAAAPTKRTRLGDLHKPFIKIPNEPSVHPKRFAGARRELCGRMRLFAPWRERGGEDRIGLPHVRKALCRK